MNKLTIVLFLVVCSCICAVLGTGMYGIAPVGYGMGYGGVSVGSGMFGASGAAGFGGLFQTLIHLFVFVFIINLLFSNGGGLFGGQNGGGLLGGQNGGGLFGGQKTRANSY